MNVCLCVSLCMYVRERECVCNEMRVYPYVFVTAPGSYKIK